MTRVTEYVFAGHGEHFYPGQPHPDPETDGVLRVPPGDSIDFHGELPPLDGLWRDLDGKAVLPRAEEPQAEDDDEGAGTGAPGGEDEDDDKGAEPDKE